MFQVKNINPRGLERDFEFIIEDNDEFPDEFYNYYDYKVKQEDINNVIENYVDNMNDFLYEDIDMNHYLYFEYVNELNNELNELLRKTEEEEEENEIYKNTIKNILLENTPLYSDIIGNINSFIKKENDILIQDGIYKSPYCGGREYNIQLEFSEMCYNDSDYENFLKLTDDEITNLEFKASDILERQEIFELQEFIDELQLRLFNDEEEKETYNCEECEKNVISNENYIISYGALSMAFCKDCYIKNT